MKPSDDQLLTEEERKKLDGNLQKHDAVFGCSSEPTPYAVHKINTGSHEPISSAPYRMSFAKVRELRSEIDKMLQTEVIEESSLLGPLQW